MRSAPTGVNRKLLHIAGERLFGEIGDRKAMRLVDSRTIGDGLVYLAYELVREG